MHVEESEVQRRLDRFRAAARAGGVKLTPQRLEIFREVAASLEHPDAETVHRAVQARMPTVSLDTVYRTLWRLKELGLVETLGPRRESVRFDANLEHHHHQVCVRCGLTRDFRSPELDRLRAPEGVAGFAEILAAHVEIRGICEECARAAEGSAPRRARRPRGRERKKP